MLGGRRLSREDLLRQGSSSVQRTARGMVRSLIDCRILVTLDEKYVNA
jgi:hypothetical protein